MRRARIMSDEMLQSIAFDAAVKEIHAAVMSGSERAAVRRLKALMTRLLEKPSEDTVFYFLKLQERWGAWVDAYAFLEQRWGDWATFKDRLELIRHKYRRSPEADNLTQSIYWTFLELEGWKSELGMGYRIGLLVRQVLETSHYVTLANELINLLDWRYWRVTNVRAYDSRIRLALALARQQTPQK